MIRDAVSGASILGLTIAMFNSYNIMYVIVIAILCLSIVERER